MGFAASGRFPLLPVHMPRNLEFPFLILKAEPEGIEPFLQFRGSLAVGLKTAALTRPVVAPGCVNSGNFPLVTGVALGCAACDVLAAAGCAKGRCTRAVLLPARGSWASEGKLARFSSALPRPA